MLHLGASRLYLEDVTAAEFCEEGGHDACDYANVGENLDDFSEVDLLQVIPFRYAPACIVTVNECLLLAAISSGHSGLSLNREFE